MFEQTTLSGNHFLQTQHNKHLKKEKNLTEKLKPENLDFHSTTVTGNKNCQSWELTCYSVLFCWLILNGCQAELIQPSEKKKKTELNDISNTRE